MVDFDGLIEKQTACLDKSSECSRKDSVDTHTYGTGSVLKVTSLFKRSVAVLSASPKCPLIHPPQRCSLLREKRGSLRLHECQEVEQLSRLWIVACWVKRYRFLYIQLSGWIAAGGGVGGRAGLVSY